MKNFLLKQQRLFLVLFLAALFTSAYAQKQTVIYPCEVWPDTDGNHIQAHGGGITRIKDTYYWYGEQRAKDIDAERRYVSCYSSKDLINWKFMGNVLEMSNPDTLASNWVLERPKVYYNEKTKKYVMYFHIDVNYKLAQVGIAVSDNPTGPFEYVRRFRPLGYESRDIGQFIDEDGSAYLIFEDRPNKGFRIAKLSDDYMDVEKNICLVQDRLEGGAIVYYDGLYYCVGSGLTGWKPNPNKYATATSLEGPWTEFKDIAPPETNTYGAQSTFLLKVVGSKETTVILMADIWKPETQWDSRYLWMPLEIGNGKMWLPTPQPFKINRKTGKTETVDTVSDALYGFKNPQDSTRTKVWWFHGETETTKEGITADLEAYKKAGVGGVVYYDQVHGKGENALPGFSSGWWEMLRFSAEEAKRLGLSFEINISNGFVAGGSWIDDEHSMKHLAASETVIKGGKPFEGKLKVPMNRYNFYRDVAVLAFPADHGKGVTSLTKPFKASSNVLTEGLDKLFDADVSSYTKIPAQGAGKPVYINMEFEDEFTARSFTYTVYAKGKSTAGAMNVPEPTEGEFKGLGYRPYPDLGQLEVSKDGVNYTKVCNLAPIYRDPMTFEQKTISFAPVKGKYYRLNLHDWWLESLITPQGEISKNNDTDLRMAKLLLSSAAKLSRWEDKAGFYSDPALIDKDFTPACSREEAIDAKSILNLSDKMDADGVLKWDVPEGNWVVMRFGYVPTGAPNKHGRKNLMGRECDRLSVKAAEFHWAHYPQLIIDSLKATGSGNLAGVIMDSHEAGSQTWTDDFIKQFIKRQGYDPTPYLPAMMGYVIDDVEKSNGFLYDIRRNIADMITDNFFGTFQRLCTKNGLILTAQAIGNGLTITGDPMQAKSAVDKGQGEFWGHHPNGNYDIKESSSAAHIYGKRIASAEAFTDVSFSQSLAHFKMLADAAYGFGINEFVICASAYQPWLDKIPGSTGGGRHYCMNRNNTWWEYSQPFWDYQARNAYILRQGKPSIDLCLYLGENAPVKILTHLLPDIPGGFDFDAFTSYALFNRMDATNGKIVLPDGVSYNMMVMPHNNNITFDALKKIADLVKRGIKIYGAKPIHSMSGRDTGKEAEYTRIADELWGKEPAAEGYNKCGKGTVYWGMPLAEAINMAAIIPDIKMKNGNTKDDMIYFAHRKLADGDIYFLDNHKNMAEEDLFTFASAGKYAQLWNTVTGERFALPVAKRDENTTAVELYFNPRESYFVVITDKDEQLPVVKWYKPVNVETITGNWNVYFDEKSGGPGNSVFDELYDWTKSSDTRIKYYSGTAVYKKTLSFNPDNDNIFIDMGNPGFVARVFVNSKEAGIVWCSPWNLDITEYLKNGENEIEIHVANSLMNRMIYDASLPENQRITYSYPVIASPNGNLVSSGLREVKMVRTK